MPDRDPLTSPGMAVSAREALETTMLVASMRVLEDFLRGVVKDAGEALDGSVLLAAGRKPPNPFAYTNVLKRWHTAVRAMGEERGDLADTRLTDLLLESNLASDAFEQSKQVLLQASTEGWTTYQTKRHLSKLLIPKEKKGVDDHSRYKTKIRRLARTAATSGYNYKALTDMDAAGFKSKKWVSMHDKLVRPTHAHADGQVQLLDAMFAVGSSLLMVPGDYNAPIGEIASCRCVIIGFGDRNPTEIRLFDGTPNPGPPSMSTIDAKKHSATWSSQDGKSSVPLVNFQDEQLAQMAQVLDRATSVFPDASKGLTGITRAYLGTRTKANYTAGKHQAIKVCWKIYTDPEQLDLSFDQGWWPRTALADRQESVIAHEVGHHVAMSVLTTEERFQLAHSLELSGTSFPVYVPAIPKAFNERNLQQWFYRSRPYILNAVSEYGTTDLEEMFAEMFAKATYGEAMPGRNPVLDAFKAIEKARAVSLQQQIAQRLGLGGTP